MYDVNLIGVEEGYARGRAGGHAPGPLLHRRGEPPPHARGGDRRRTSRRACSPTSIRSARPSLVDGHEFTVIGTMLRPAASFFGDTDNRVLLPYGTMQKMYPNARENAIVVTAHGRQTAAGAGRSPHRAAHRPPRALRQARQLRALHRRADGLRFPPDHRHDVPGDGGAQLHRAAGGRHRRDEHHAGLGDRAHARNRHSQSHRRAKRPIS